MTWYSSYHFLAAKEASLSENLKVLHTHSQRSLLEMLPHLKTSGRAHECWSQRSSSSKLGKIRSIKADSDRSMDGKALLDSSSWTRLNHFQRTKLEGTKEIAGNSTSSNDFFLRRLLPLPIAPDPKAMASMTIWPVERKTVFKCSMEKVSYPRATE